MVYLYEVKNKKGTFQVYGVACAFPLISVLIWFLTENLVATIIFLVVGLCLSFYTFKTIKKLTNGKVVTYDEGLTAYAPGKDVFEFTWKEVTHAGRVKKEGEDDRYFIYAEEKDKILKITRNYKNIDGLVEEIQKNTPFKDYILNENETIEDVLKKELNISS